MFNPLAFLHHILPLRFKFLPESYVLKDNKNIKGLITVAPISRHQKKVEIKKLFFEENSFADAAELIQFAVSKYKAKGAYFYAPFLLPNRQCMKANNPMNALMCVI